MIREEHQQKSLCIAYDLYIDSNEGDSSPFMIVILHFDLRLLKVTMNVTVNIT